MTFPGGGHETAVRLRRHEANATSTSASTSGGSVVSQDLPSSLRIFESATCRPPATKFAALRNEIRSPSLSFLLEAHDGLSAKIVEEAGFRGIWASGLTMSAALGLRDSNEASWTQVLDVLEYMADATSLPILVDGDTGHGNFNNVRRFVRKLCERGLAESHSGSATDPL